MKTLIFGAGPLGSIYACLLHQAGKDVTILARNKQYDFIKGNGVVLLNEFTQEQIVEKVKVVDALKETDAYDLVIVIMRKNNLKNVLPLLSKNKKIRNILFMGNNALGFKQYLKLLPKEKVLFGFPEAVLIKILQQVFNSRFAEVAMMMHVRSAGDEMLELAKEFQSLKNQTSVKTPNLDELISCIS